MISLGSAAASIAGRAAIVATVLAFIATLWVQLGAAEKRAEDAAERAGKAESRTKALDAVQDAWCDQCVSDGIRVLLGADCQSVPADAAAGFPGGLVEELR